MWLFERPTTHQLLLSEDYERSPLSQTFHTAKPLRLMSTPSTNNLYGKNNVEIKNKNNLKGKNIILKSSIIENIKSKKWRSSQLENENTLSIRIDVY